MAPNASAISIPATVTAIEGNALDATQWFKDAVDTVYAGKILYKVKSATNALVVAEGTTAIAEGAAKNVPVASVTLPSTLTAIGSMAFGFCDALNTVNMPQGAVTIGSGAFEYCSADMPYLS